MRLDMTFEESNQRIDVQFAEVQTASDGGFERGYAQCKKETDAYFDDINDALNEKLSNEEQYEPSEMGDAIRGIDTKDYLPYAKEFKIHTLNIFEKAEVELNLDSCDSLYLFCNVVDTENRNTTVEHLTINNANGVNDFRSAFNCNYTVRDEKLKHLTLNFSTSKVTSFQNAFNCMIALEIIDGNPLDFSSVNLSSNAIFLNMFNYNMALKEVRFVENTIPKNISFNASSLLSDESIQSIIDGLADLTEQTSQKVTFSTTVVNKLTTEQMDAIWAKNWEVG